MFELLWFDSMGAKSSSVLVRCGRGILLDPGIAIMHPGFPASPSQKIAWYEAGRKRILEALREAETVIITHYHHDHYLHDAPHLFKGKRLLVKDPNEFINLSQRDRALEFFGSLYGGLELEETPEKEYADPGKELRKALSRDYGDYWGRKKELLERGSRWFERMAKRWSSWGRIPELRGVRFADGRSFDLGGVKISFSNPLFHGVEYSRLGWVISAVVECKGKRLLHSSDLNGPVIEDYADWIVSRKPNILILDGPPTYLLGFTMNRINLRRAVENAIWILENCEGLELVIYDHHLTREPRFRERTKTVWERARKLGIDLVTAAEFLGSRPVVLSA